jgi:uncharacterized membrane protein HdeD (DUF308 family)
MKILQSSVFRAICAIAVGIMLIKYPDNTVTWITIAIGVLFLLSGIISMVTYYHALKNVSEYTITDAEGNVVSGQKPTFPIVGVGSAILGLILALTPNVFVKALMYIIGAVLILGAINQFMNLLNARKYGKIGFGYWIFPSVILLIGLFVITAGLLLAWGLYGITSSGPIWLVYVLAMLLALFFSSFGLIVSNYSDTMQQAVFVMWFFVVCLMLLSGLFTPTRSMPHWAYLTIYVNPMHYFIDAIRTVFIRGGTFQAVAHQILALLSIGLVMACWAVQSYKKNN